MGYHVKYLVFSKKGKKSLKNKLKKLILQM